MRIPFLLAAGIALAGAAFIAPPATAGSSPVADQMTAQTMQADELSAKKRKRAYRGYRAYGGTQIACTRFGCNPIPPGCRIITGRTWDGTPSGFDDVICPYR